MYHVTVDNQIPYNVLRQQAGRPVVSRGRATAARRVRRRQRHPARRCGTRSAAARAAGRRPIRVDPNIVWSSASGSGSVGGIVARYDESTATVRATSRSGPSRPTAARRRTCKYRFNWTLPLTISPHDRNTVYVGSQHVHRTTERRPELAGDQPGPDDSTTRAGSRFSGGLTRRQHRRRVRRSSCSRSPSRALEKGLIWAGTNDGQVQVTRDGGKTWTNVTTNIPNLPPWGTVGNIEPSRYDAGTAYLTVDLPPGEQPRSVRLQDDRLRQDVDERSPTASRRAC